ncbi:MAG TPA: hypothetical protein VED02_06090 [Methyloceanibacter sp.]|nr:hypothetical protein [Methyloceanibacter sp.]
MREKPWLGTPRLSHPDGEGAPPTLLARKKPVVTPAFAAGIQKCSVEEAGRQVDEAGRRRHMSKPDAMKAMKGMGQVLRDAADGRRF